MAIITLAAYSNSFRVPFQFDDYPNIVQNASIFLKDFSLSWFKHLVQVNYKGSIRIFAYLTFALNYYLAGLNVFSYHVINFFIHLSSGLLLYWFLLLTFRPPLPQGALWAHRFSCGLLLGPPLPLPPHPDPVRHLYRPEDGLHGRPLLSSCHGPVREGQTLLGEKAALFLAGHGRQLRPGSIHQGECRYSASPRGPL